MPEFISDNEIRTLIGTVLFVGGMVCYWFCAYKCLTCLKERERRQNIITVAPRQTFVSNV
jgi:hypothetical protein